MATEDELFGEIDLGRSSVPLAGQRNQPRQGRRQQHPAPKRERKAAAAGRVVSQDATRQNQAAARQRAAQQPKPGQQDLWGQSPQQGRAPQQQPQLQRTTRSQRHAARQNQAMPSNRQAVQQVPENQPGRKGPIAAGKELAASLKGERASVVYERFMMWLYTHPFIIILAGVIMIAIGLLVNRYISFGAAIVFLILGWLMNRDEEKDPLVCFAVAFAVFLIPYFF